MHPPSDSTPELISSNQRNIYIIVVVVIFFSDFVVDVVQLHEWSSIAQGVQERVEGLELAVVVLEVVVLLLLLLLPHLDVWHHLHARLHVQKEHRHHVLVKKAVSEN